MSIELTVALIAISIAVIFVYLRVHYSYWTRRHVVHEPPIYLLGNMRGLGRSYHFRDINQRIYKMFKNSVSDSGSCPPIVGVYTFLNRAAMILDLELVKQILVKDFGSFSNRGLFHNVRDDPLTGNLLFLDGEPWRVLRHKLSPVFTTGKMRFMFPTIVAVGQQLVTACRASTDDVVDVKDLCARYTTDVIGTCAFGIECNSLRDPNAEFRRMGRSIFEQPRHSLLVQAWMFAAPDLARKLRFKNFRDDVSAFFMGVVRETVEYRERNGVRRNDFMDILLELKAQRDALDADPAAPSCGSPVDYNPNDLNNGLTFEQLAAQAMIFFLAGFETSSTTLSFCLYELALNEDIQNKLREEIHKVLAQHEGKVSYEAVREMNYLRKVIYETLRKHSVLPHTVRKTTTDYTVPHAITQQHGMPDLVLPRGMTILIPVDAIHKDPQYYPNPEKFDPERFNAEAVLTRHSHAFLPFGDGPRNCIGLRFGLMQTEIGLISLLKEFQFKIALRTTIPIEISKKSFPVTPAGGVWLRVEPVSCIN